MNGVIFSTLIPIPILDPCSRKSLRDPIKAKKPDRLRPACVSGEYSGESIVDFCSVNCGVIKLSGAGDAASASPTMIIRLC